MFVSVLSHIGPMYEENKTTQTSCESLEFLFILTKHYKPISRVIIIQALGSLLVTLTLCCFNV